MAQTVFAVVRASTDMGILSWAWLEDNARIEARKQKRVYGIDCVVIEVDQREVILSQHYNIGRVSAVESE